eukprot:TRINITY_DN50588_c0_g1_i1.p1 TRINITY_DN50588_c0_g1~~TRINITY_DN50588_c0_g1_i1.p1  ORF type:complete len:305 (-),score=61.61 TRINITY_DN50588_c0_g1_i1:565-1479(-)
MDVVTPSVVLCTAGFDHQIKFWEPSNGLCYHKLNFEDSQVNTMKITSNKQYLVAAGNPIVKLFEIESQNKTPVATYDGHSSSVTSVGFQVDSKWMFSGSEDKTIKIWDVRSKSCKRDYENGSPINSVVIHPNQGELISADQDGYVCVWDLTANKLREKIKMGSSSVHSVSIRNDGLQLAAVNEEGMCVCYSSEGEGEFVKTKEFKAHDERVLHCEISPDGTTLATTSSDHTVKMWNNLEDHTLKKTLTKHCGWVWDCVFSADSSYLITASSDHTSKLWEIKSGGVVMNYSGHTKPITCLALNDL